MLDAQAVQAVQAGQAFTLPRRYQVSLTPTQTEIDMVIEETPLDQETIEECNVPLEIAAIKTLLGQQQDSIEENGELITTAGAKIFELEPVINKIEEEFPIVKNKLRAYCKQTLDSFSDELDDMARADRDKWDCVHESVSISLQTLVKPRTLTTFSPCS
ncbi:hypothetical protein NW760_008204 [Fusarium oxysporum]|nr:hypothetical protein NW769_003011 [Fusarium oxysporum]KAJ4227496.1 hypothetical protein NW760_008204 [Fusarium oxysporum]